MIFILYLKLLTRLRFPIFRTCGRISFTITFRIHFCQNVSAEDLLNGNVERMRCAERDTSYDALHKFLRRTNRLQGMARNDTL
jgi:hypothetical protein